MASFIPRDKRDLGLAISNVSMDTEADEPSRILRKPFMSWSQIVQDDPKAPVGTRPHIDPMLLEEFRTPSPRNGLSFPESAARGLKNPPRPELLSASSFQSTFSDASTRSYSPDPNSRLLGSTSHPSSPDPRFTSASLQSRSQASSSRKFWWQSAWIMYLLFFFGICGALGHHCFYASLSGTEAHDQLKMLRYGATLAYLAKTFLVSSIVLAFRQQIWATFRRKLLSINAIDALFSAVGDLDALLNTEIYRQAKIAVFLVAVLWLTPLTVILTPATLVVEPALWVNETTCPNVRTLNFTPESTNEWRTSEKISGLYELSLSFWNTTSLNTNDPNFFDYYTTPSQPVQQVATLSAYLQRVVVRPDAAIDICGSGWNCSFTVNFTGPGYKCAPFRDSDVKLNGTTVSTPPFDSSTLVPKGNFSYYVLANIGDYVSVQVDSGDAGIPSDPPPYPPHLGVFRTEPVIWIGYTTLKDPSQPLPSNSSDPRYATAFEPHTFYCEHYETHYTVDFNYSAGSQTTSVTNRTFLTPIINTTYIPNQNAHDGTKDNTTAFPEGNYIYPKDLRRYRLTAAYHSLGAMLRQFVNSTIDAQHPASPITKTEATTTRLIDKRTYLAYPDLVDQIQYFYEDILLSLFSNPQFLVVAWASDPSRPSGTQSGAAGGMYPCTKSRMLNVFIYKKRDLWLIYGSIILLAGVGVLFGAIAVFQNGGYLRDIRFSSIVAATRSPGLDHLEWNRRSYGGDGHIDVGDVKLGYGQVGGSAHLSGQLGTDYHGFGLEGEVRQLARMRGRWNSVWSLY